MPQRLIDPRADLRNAVVTFLNSGAFIEHYELWRDEPFPTVHAWAVCQRRNENFRNRLQESYSRRHAADSAFRALANDAEREEFLDRLFGVSSLSREDRGWRKLPMSDFSRPETSIPDAILPGSGTSFMLIMDESHCVLGAIGVFIDIGRRTFSWFDSAGFEFKTESPVDLFSMLARWFRRRYCNAVPNATLWLRHYEN